MTTLTHRRGIRMGVAVLAALFLLVSLTPPASRAAEEALFIDFDDGTLMGFETRGTDEEKAEGTGVLTVVTEAARSGGYSLLTTGRRAAWNGPALNVASYVVPGIYYDVSVWVLPKTPERSTFKLSTQVGQGASAEYFNIEVKDVSISDGWTELSGRFIYSDEDFITVYVENDTRDAEFYIDDLSFSAPPGGDGIAESILLPSLSEIYQDYFLLGSAFSRQDLSGQRFELIRRHFNVMTAGNAMKPDALGGRGKGEYNFTNADAMIDTLAGILIHGHTLVWHSQSAAWLNQDSDGAVLTRAEARANMEEFINTVAGHYAGRVISWDVVNEAFQNSAGSAPADWRDALRKGDAPWYGAYENGADKSAGESGADYIYDAFVFTRLADPGAILYFNDFNETEPGKREAIAMMAEELNGKWKSDPRNAEPDRLLIEGLGMQAHYWTDSLNPRDVEETIIRWAATGAEVSITELDIPMGNYSRFKPLDIDEEEKQALLYAQLFQIFKKHSADIARVTFWGVDDPTSWRSGGSPLLFGEDTVAKQAFYAVMDPDGFIKGNYDRPAGGSTAASPPPASEPDAPGKPPESPEPPESPQPPGQDGGDEPDDTAPVSYLSVILGSAAAVAAVAALIVLLLRSRRRSRG